MASVSFTYNGDYDPGNTVVLRQNALNYYDGPGGNHTLGPFFNDRYIMNDDGVYGIYGTYFIDSQRFDGDPADQSNKIMTGSEYSISLDLSDNTGFLYITGSNFGDILRAGSGADTLNGGGGNDILDGGAGADIFDGGTGINTITYERSSEAVVVVLSDVGHFGDAEGDTYSNIQNITGSSFNDFLQGDDGNNALRGNGGNDALLGMGGNDRLVISGNATLTEGMGAPMLDGGDGKDSLFFVAGELDFAYVELSKGSIGNIEQIYVRGGVHIDMSAVTEGQSVTSQSTLGHHAEILGTSGADRITAGKGGDAIDGGAGGDKLFAGSSSDTFHYQAGFGRDNVYGFDVNADHIAVHIAGATGATLKEFHNGQDTIVTFAGVEGTNKIILHDVTVAQIEAGPSDLFTFGA
ncbi:calcium-binding protein [Methylobacterium sp. W2]|uniref:calcium-binding protein n=1 Tax=Methylobacterium sp. W2 TaxID=2598107 RepID=UPI001D0C8632|nr:calcium-binding protein [Methylobacterium sp. W2]MCC0808943.1 calcium-binding protein [Methylobacterium sp. W2]